MGLIDLCTCGHPHLSGDECHCGCTAFNPADDDEYPVGSVVG